MKSFLIRNTEITPARPLQDVRIEGGYIVEIGVGLSDEEMVDARGGALLPGLSDHHIHLFSSASQLDSLDVEGLTNAKSFRDKLIAHARSVQVGTWIRVTGYHESIAGDLMCEDLDALAPRHRVRVQHQSGALWVLNSLALKSVLAGADAPACVELRADKSPNGRILRGDAWLRSRLRSRHPDLAAIGARLAAYGVTALTDASVTNGEDDAAAFVRARKAGALPQRLRLMSGGRLQAPDGGEFSVGEVKVLLDEATLPDLEKLREKIEFARQEGRGLALHCVSAVELAFAVAGLQAFGVPRGSRIEHASVVPQAMLAELRALGVAVVTQPGLLWGRGDRYLADTEIEEQGDLYRGASFIAAGVHLAFSSDAPYGPIDPWIAIKAAVARQTRGDQIINASEKVEAGVALRLHSGELARPGREWGRVELGAPADICLLRAPLEDALADPNSECVALTLIGGEIAYQR